jgi:hypothetical protein
MLPSSMIWRRSTPRHSFDSRFTARSSLSRSPRAQQQPQPQSPHAFTSQLSGYPGVGGLPSFSMNSAPGTCSHPVGVLKPTPASATTSKSLPASDLCVLCVSVFSSPNLSPFNFKLLAPFTLSLEGSTFICFSQTLSSFNFKPSTFNCFSPIPFRIRTFAKHPPNPFGMRSFKTKDLKLFRMSIYKKTGAPVSRRGISRRRREVHPLRSGDRLRCDHLRAVSGAGSALFVQARVAGISRPSKLKDETCGAGVKLAAAAPDMTCWKAAWKRSISACVPTVMRT